MWPMGVLQAEKAWQADWPEDSWLLQNSNCLTANLENDVVESIMSEYSKDTKQ